MESTPARDLSSVREKEIEEIVQGHAYAAQLQRHLELTGSGDCHLVTNILSSFTNALSILSSSTESGAVPASLPNRQYEGGKQFKERKMQETLTRITAMPIEDGYAWRKYGEKDILNAKHRRCYYRCSYKFDKGCQATKQVQRTEDEPPMFLTKYMGHHTCQINVLKASSMDPIAKEGFLLNFESSTQTKQESPFLSSSPSSKEAEHIKSLPSIKQDYNPSSLEDHPPQDPTEFKSCIPTSVLPLTTLQSGHGDVVLGCNTSSSSSLDMAMELMDSVYINDPFWFSDDELF